MKNRGEKTTLCKLFSRLEAVEKSFQLRPPEMCEPELREMIVACFADDPKRRPKFTDIVQKLDVLCHRVDQ